MLFNNRGIKTKILSIPILIFALIAVLFVVEGYFNNAILHKVQLPTLGESVLNGSKELLKAAVDVQVTSIGEAIKDIDDKEKVKDMVVELTDPLRFFDDNSGYFFTYYTDGTRVSVPPNKAGNGKNFWDLQDLKGNYLVRDLVQAAKNGGDFVFYYFEKPGKGVQPKLSYAKLIPGTDIFVGAGVYVDHVEAAKSELYENVKSEKASYLKYRVLAWAIIIFIAISVSLLITGSIVKPLKHVMNIISENAENMTMSSQNVAGASQQLAEGASSQAASVEETSSSLEELTSRTAKNTENTTKTNSLSSEANKAALSGRQSMAEMSTALSEMQKSSEEVSKVIKVIDEIAFQTNLLALNAAVEAARAGEAGKGFAVVSEEVRNLAMRSAEAAKDTTAMIEKSVKNSELSTEVIQGVEHAFDKVVETSGKVSDLMDAITESNQEQSSGLNHINLAMNQIDRVTQSNAANAEECASAADELRSQAQHSKQIVSTLRNLIEGKGFSAAGSMGKSDELFHDIAGGKKVSKKTDVLQYDFS